MQFIFTIMLTLAFALSMLQCEKSSAISNTNAAKNSSTAATTTPVPDDAPRISLADAKKDFDSGAAIFVDTRAAESYKNEHVKGSINVPLGDFEAHYKDIPTDKKIIAYCS